MTVFAATTADDATDCSSARVSTALPSSTVAARAPRTAPSRSAGTPVTPSAVRSPRVSVDVDCDPLAVCITRCARSASASTSAMESMAEAGTMRTCSFIRAMPAPLSAAAVVAPIAA